MRKVEPTADITDAEMLEAIESSGYPLEQLELSLYREFQTAGMDPTREHVNWFILRTSFEVEGEVHTSALMLSAAQTHGAGLRGAGVAHRMRALSKAD